MKANIQSFFHSDSNTISYVVFDQIGGHAIIIDSVLDFVAHSGKVGTEFADSQIAFIKENQLTLDWILETHAHADHLSAAHYLQSKLDGKIAVSKEVTQVQRSFKEILNISDSELSANGDVFDHLFEDDETFSFGKLSCRLLATPGHTSDSVTYLIENNAFVGDTLFMPDSGTARCDFPGGSAEILFDSINKLHQLPDKTKLWMCHDYQPLGRGLAFVTTVEESRSSNIHIRDGVNRASFVKLREERDSGLDVPQLLYPSVQVNIRAGRFPSEEAKGKSYMKIPLSHRSQS